MNVFKAGFLIAAFLVLALAMWAVNRDMESSDPIQRPESTPFAPRSSDQSLPPPLANEESQEDDAGLPRADEGISTSLEAVFASDADDVSLPTGDSRLENEPVDENWAPQMESLMWSLISTIGEVLEVECRTTICRMAVIPTDTESAKVFFNQTLMDSFQAVIVDSDGRLDGLMQDVFDTPDGRSGITITMGRFRSPPEAEATASP